MYNNYQLLSMIAFNLRKLKKSTRKGVKLLVITTDNHDLFYSLIVAISDNFQCENQEEVCEIIISQMESFR